MATVQKSIKFALEIGHMAPDVKTHVSRHRHPLLLATVGHIAVWRYNHNKLLQEGFESLLRRVVIIPANF